MSNIDKKTQNNKINQKKEECKSTDKKYDIWLYANDIEIERNSGKMIISNLKNSVAYSLFANKEFDNDKLAFKLSPNELETRLNESIDENKNSPCKVEFQSDNKNVKVIFYLRSIKYQDNKIYSDVEITEISCEEKKEIELSARIIGTNIAANYFNLWQWCAPNFSPVAPYKIKCPKGYKLSCTNTRGSNCVCVKKKKSKDNPANLKEPICTGGANYELTKTFKCLCKKK